MRHRPTQVDTCGRAREAALRTETETETKGKVRGCKLTERGKGAEIREWQRQKAYRLRGPGQRRPRGPEGGTGPGTPP